MLQQYIMFTSIQVGTIQSFVSVISVGDPSFYENTLRSALGPNFSTEGFTIEKKADATYKIVSAGEINPLDFSYLSVASIIAKVTRDHLTAMWAFKGTGRIIDSNYGSGYPSDEKCVEWFVRCLGSLTLLGWRDLFTQSLVILPI
jgi:ribonuclease HII